MVSYIPYWKEENPELDKWENIFCCPEEARLKGVPFEGQMAIIRRQKLLKEIKKNGITETRKNEGRD